MSSRRGIIPLVVIVLLAGTISGLVSEPVASEPEMDNDLGFSIASYVGEHAGDMSSMYISGAGDVNGDGYYDFVIGAPGSDAGGSRRGQAYLIFGMSSGWRNDVNLSRANASFLGEVDGDSAGNVVGVGDVNGDGYDDIVVGALQNDEGGNGAGQIYLVLGRSSGWSMNTSLSSSDASFIGENAGDRAGQRVAGAGDVNGDGYDDILIGSYSNEDGGDNAGKVYLVLGKASGWSMDTSLSSASASFIGEDADDSAARCARAGDVDGDGYDDILIGAVTDSDVDEYAGQVYLILGMASGWSRDTDLSNADASFLGEGRWDFCGDGNGVDDVNGDGYDDILIGASGNNSDTGKSYLIFGRTSGWTMDTNVSQAANASFIGEKKGDYAYGIGGAGDVNGDGYHDFLIDASGSDDGKLDRGQMYLILGKDTGWSLNTSLSNADASFLGENQEDGLRTGAGAGDVNGDGYDDIIMGTYVNDDGGTSAGKTYLIYFDDGEDPKVDMGATPNLATTGDAFSFKLNASDDTGIRSVHFEYWSGNDTTHLNASAAMTSGDRWISTWALNITVPEDRVDTLHYRSHVWDRSFNLVSSKVQDVSVMDNDPPTFEQDMTPSSATTGDAVFFQVEVNDNVNVSQVIVNYYFEGAGVNHTQYMMRVPPGTTGLWTLGIAVPSDSLALLHYQFGAVDNSSNGKLTDWSVITILDDDAPEFIGDLTDPNATTGSYHTFEVEVIDNINLTEVRVEYWLGEGPSTNATMVNQSVDLWTYTIHIPLDMVGMIFYTFYASDNSSNVDVTEMKEITVRDDDRPIFGRDTTGSIATTGDPQTFRVNVTDWIEVSSVHVLYWWGTDEPVNATMLAQTGDWWSHRITTPSDSLEPLHYRFEAVDTSNNWNRTLMVTVLVTDNDAPTIGNDTTPETATTGDDLLFSVRCEDNIGIESVVVSFMYSNGTTTNLELDASEDDYWTVPITVEHTLEDLQYLFIANDTSGNIETTAVRIVEIVDNDDPGLVEDLSDEQGTTGDVYHARVLVRDNIGIASVNSTATWTPVDVDEDGNGVYGYEIPIDPDYVGRFYLGITVTDTSGNEGYFELQGREVVDDDPPEILLIQIEASWWKGWTYSIPFEVEDNIGVDGIFIEHRFGDGEVTNETVESVHHIQIPRHPDGDLMFHIVAVDEAGNWVETLWYPVVLHNVVPKVSDLPTWDVVESTDAEIDLSTYISDGNDDTFTLECSDDGVTVEGMVLKVRHDTVVPDYTVTFTVSDGEDEVEGELTIRVANVNDPPVITFLLPENGTRVKEGKKLVLSVTTEDEDGDHITVSWIEDGEVLAEGPRPEVKLKPGEHVITVVVDDGTDQVEDTLTIVIRKEEESPGPGLALALAAVVLAGLDIQRRRPLVIIS